MKCRLYLSLFTPLHLTLKMTKNYRFRSLVSWLSPGQPQAAYVSNPIACPMWFLRDLKACKKQAQAGFREMKSRNSWTVSIDTVCAFHTSKNGFDYRGFNQIQSTGRVSESKEKYGLLSAWEATLNQMHQSDEGDPQSSLVSDTREYNAFWSGLVR